MVNSPHFRGYTRAGFELTRGRRDWREQFDVNTERAAREIGPDTPPWARLQGPNQWPAALPDLKPVVLAWQAAATDVAIRLLKAFAIALDQPENVFEPIYAGSPNQHIKLIRYPGRDATDDDQGVGAHKDSGFLTLLLQDIEPGLEVETDTGWVGAPPLKGSFIVNIGEILEMASNGYLRATVHRVVTPPAGRDRLSVAFFSVPTTTPRCRFSNCRPRAPPRRRGPRATRQTRSSTKSAGTISKRLRSHPDVARRHYADLVATPADAVASSGY